MAHKSQCKTIGWISAALGIGVLITCCLILHDCVQHKRVEWERQFSYYQNAYYVEDQYVFPFTILVVVGVLGLFIAIPQFITSMYMVFASDKKIEKTTLIWIFVHVGVLLAAIACFTLAMYFGVHTLDFKTREYEQFNGSWQSNAKAFLSLYYGKGQAYCALVGIDVILLTFLIFLVIRWRRNFEV